MTQSSPRHHEILLSLAREIRQAMDWLSLQEQPPPLEEIRPRLRTLQEAASVAGMNSVGNILDSLDKDEIEGKDSTQKPAVSSIQRVLEQLSSLIATMATSAEKKELVWVARIQETEAILEQASLQMSQSVSRLAHNARLVDICTSMRGGEDRTAWMAKLQKNIRYEADRQRSLHELLQETSARLRDASRKLIRELSKLSTTPLTPYLARLREQMRCSGRELGKPVSLHPRCSGLEVGVSQAEPIARVLDFLAHLVLLEGIEKPEERRSLGKATVGSIRLVGSQSHGLLTIDLEDDGKPNRPEPRLSRAVRQDLQQLRARLLKETSSESGQRLSLQIPIWTSTVEGIPLRTPVGECLVPLSVVTEAFAAGRQPKVRLPEVRLERRARHSSANKPSAGVVLQVGPWQGILYAEILGGHVRVIPTPPADDDPLWVIARVNEETGSRPLVHPLHFTGTKKHQTRLFPATR